MLSSRVRYSVVNDSRYPMTLRLRVWDRAPSDYENVILMGGTVVRLALVVGSKMGRRGESTRTFYSC